MRWTVVVAVLALCAGCSRDRYAPMGANAPAFGSTPELATIQGFIVGSWRESYEPSAEPGGPQFLRAALAQETPVITLSSDRTVTLHEIKHEGCVAHGTWSVQGDRVALAFTDVDGLTFDQVQAQLSERRDENRQVRHILPPLSRHTPYIPEGVALTRTLVASECHAIPNLVIAADGKRLEEVFDQRADDDRRPEKAVWLRVK